MPAYKTRIAPSPTGHLHLGHALHILCVQGMAQNFGADIVLRLEDHDQSRCRPEFAASILEDLTWLGVSVPTNPWRQSTRSQVYQTHLEDLMRRGLIYACLCTRKDIQQSLDQESGELRYPGTCRDQGVKFDHPGSALRLRMPSSMISYVDLFLGKRQENPAEQCGDVVIRDRLGQWTYQFAVVIDDLEQKINLIIRGEDLVSSTARQLAMRKILNPLQPDPLFAHHPIIRNSSGAKLSKRILSEGLAVLRQKGVLPDDLRGQAAYLAGLTETPRPLTLAALTELFRDICQRSGINVPSSGE